MAEIFLAGVLVSFVKLMAYGSIGGRAAAFSHGVYFVSCNCALFQCVDRRWLWDDIADARTAPAAKTRASRGYVRGCVRAPVVRQSFLLMNPCARVVVPKGTFGVENSLQWTLALLVTSIMLYLPANILPIMVTDLLGSKMPSTILAGGHSVMERRLLSRRCGDLFLASIMVPTLKMIAIAWLCWDAKGHGKRDSERMHLIYEVVEFVGRWSMIDVFVIAVLSALVRMGGLMSIYPAMGALMFALVVIMTMFSAMTFDPRLSWDRQPESEHEES